VPLRRVIVVAHSGSLADALRDMLPLLTATVSAALLVSHGVRRDAALHMWFGGDSSCLTFLGERVRQLRPDEQSLGGVLKKARLRLERPGGLQRSRSVHPGVLVSRASLADVLSVSARGQPPVLRLKCGLRGRDIREVRLSGYRRIVLLAPLAAGDYKLIGEVDEGLLEVRASLSRLDAPQLIVLFHNEVDRVEWRGGAP